MNSRVLLLVVCAVLLLSIIFVVGCEPVPGSMARPYTDVRVVYIYDATHQVSIWVTMDKNTMTTVVNLLPSSQVANPEKDFEQDILVK